MGVMYFHIVTCKRGWGLHQIHAYTLKTNTSKLAEDGDSIFKLLRRVSYPEIKFGRVNHLLDEKPQDFS